jgi:hypothetical protein
MIYFREVQRFRQPWYWAIQIPALAALAYILCRQLVLGKPVGDHPAANTSLAIIAATIALFVVWFIKLELITEVRDDVLEVRFRGLFVRRVIPLAEIRNFEARTYRPIREYGGWGVRSGAGGMAYNVSGNRGVDLRLTDGKSLMIGSQRPEEFALALRTRTGAK